MRIIEHSLGAQQRAEVYVNRLLRYLLNPDESHGMEAEFLRAFLKGLQRSAAFRRALTTFPESMSRPSYGLSDGPDLRFGRIPRIR